MFNNTDKHHEAKGYTCEIRLLLQLSQGTKITHTSVDKLDNGKLHVGTSNTINVVLYQTISNKWLTGSTRK